MIFPNPGKTKDLDSDLQKSVLSGGNRNLPLIEIPQIHIKINYILLKDKKTIIKITAANFNKG